MASIQNSIRTPRKDVVWTFGPRPADGADPGAAAEAPPRRRKQLTEIEAFGANPGSLRMLAHLPDDLAPGAPLVVVLHGCSQDAERYDAASGWSALADELGFALLYPEQRRSNNPGGCFNWFLTADAARGLGEARSIREMIETLVERQGLDRSRVFVTGLSAGGAMAASLLGDYPDVFAAGAVIAGLPCGAAANMNEAFAAMSRPARRSDRELGDAVRAGAPYDGPWPRISIWHGLADRTVAPENAEQLVRQWLDVHGAADASMREETADGRLTRIWSVDGREIVEATTIVGMDHGTPLDGRLGERAAPFMLDVGISSTRAIAAFFGLEDGAAAIATPGPRAARPAATRSGRDASQGRRRPEGPRLDAARIAPAPEAARRPAGDVRPSGGGRVGGLPSAPPDGQAGVIADQTVSARAERALADTDARVAAGRGDTPAEPAWVPMLAGPATVAGTETETAAATGANDATSTLSAAAPTADRSETASALPDPTLAAGDEHRPAAAPQPAEPAGDQPSRRSILRRLDVFGALRRALTGAGGRR